MTTATLNEQKMMEMAGKVVADLGAVTNTSLVRAGDRLGLYRALDEQGPMTSAELASHTGTSERYVREWLASQAASEYITYDPESERFFMSPEQAAVFVVKDSPVYLMGGFDTAVSVIRDEDKLDQAFTTGEGIAWGNHDGCLFCGTAKFLGTGYHAFLLPEWLPALDGVVEKLEAGAHVADVGCGYGVSTMLMAEAYPNSTFIGFDLHEPSIAHARGHAKETGIPNVQFEVAEAKDFNSGPYDLVTFFDCLHDMGDPVGAISHVRTVLKKDGSVMLVEPFAHDKLEDNLNPVGRLFYSVSASVCTASALSQAPGFALGAQAGEARLRDVLNEGGLSQVRRATETPFNLVLEAKI